MSTPLTSPEGLREFLEFGRDIAQEAGWLTLKYFGKNLEVMSKKDSSPVTEADLEAEKLLRSLISERYPDHGILGEEFEAREASTSSGPQYQWVLDPIDGTKSFVHGIPLYTNLIALLEDGQPILGIINNPALEELTWAAVGSGAWMNGNPIRVSDCKDLSKAWLQVTDPTDLLRRHPDAAYELIKSVGYTRTWADGHGYAMLARGKADIMLDPIVSLWDVACLKPIVEEAGGRFSDLQGLSKLGTSCLASNGHLHEDLLAFFHK